MFREVHDNTVAPRQVGDAPSEIVERENRNPCAVRQPAVDHVACFPFGDLGGKQSSEGQVAKRDTFVRYSFANRSGEANIPPP